MSDNTLVSKFLAKADAHMGQPIPLRGADIARFALQHGLYTSDTGMALGINTSGLYSKKNSEARLSASISILLRLYSAFPECIPRITPPQASALIDKISAIDPTFKKSHLGPLLGMETNSSFRLISEGIANASQTVKNILYIIDTLISANPAAWFVIKEIIEIEAESRMITPRDTIWARGGWTRTLKGLAPRRGARKADKTGDGEPAAKPEPLEKAPQSTAKKLIRRGPVNGKDGTTAV